MMLPQQWEQVAEERMADWKREARYQQVLAQLPAAPSRWRQWTGGMMVWCGTWLLRWGERMARRECAEGVSVTG